jgi:hypothetical protein
MHARCKRETGGFRGQTLEEPRNAFLIAGALMSALAAALHVGCIVFGAPWYRFFGAGERMAQMAIAGSWYPTIVTALIASVLGGWSLCALSGASVIRALPLLRPALYVITGIYLLRGLAILPLAVLGRATPFWWWSSAICLLIGAVHLVGVLQVWPRLP